MYLPPNERNWEHFHPEDWAEGAFCPYPAGSYSDMPSPIPVSSTHRELVEAFYERELKYWGVGTAYDSKEHADAVLSPFDDSFDLVTSLQQLDEGSLNKRARVAERIWDHFTKRR